MPEIIVQPNADHSAMTVADLALNNVELAPLPGSPLYSLVNEVLHRNTYTGEEELSAESAIALVASTINSDDELAEFVKELTEVVSKAVSANIRLAHQEVLPLIRSISEDVIKAYKERVEGVGLNVEVVPFSGVAILTSGKLETYLPSDTVDIDSVSAESPSCFISTPTDILSLLKTGAASVDAEIDEWIAGLNNATAKIAHVWAAIFATNTPIDMRDRIIGKMDYNDQLTTFLFARHLLSMDRDELVTMADNISLVRLLVALKQAEDIASIGIRSLYKKRERAKARGDLILSAPTSEMIRGSARGTLNTSFEILVDEDLYEAFLANGGTPDAIIGAVVHQGRASATELLERISFFTRIAERTAAIVAETAESQRLSIARDTIRRELFAVVESMCDGDRSAYVNQLASIEPKVEGILSNLTPGCIKDVYGVVTDVVCSALFDDTDVRIIIDNINRHGSADTGADIREIAALSTIDYVSRFMVGQILAVRNS